MIRLAAVLLVSIFFYTAQASAQQSLVGSYQSSAFAPRPLVLTITQVDPAGNISGEFRGMREDMSAWWRRPFGAPGGWTARLYNSSVVVVADGKVRYQLQPTATGFSGNYYDPPNDRPIIFTRTQ
ncbi:MAG: hypothetical protein JO267_05595 [Alphaproteobacteria bacterium]|nr:hypothetical protein [Alphaproteobacteria bacterium]